MRSRSRRTEVGLAFLAVNLVTGSIWGRIIWGIWWTWDARLTSVLICWLLYAGYLMLRRAIEEPTQRARISRGLQHLRVHRCAHRLVFHQMVADAASRAGASAAAAASIRHGMDRRLVESAGAGASSALVLLLIRLRQEEVQREIDSMRRYAARHLNGARFQWIHAISLSCFMAFWPPG